LYLVVTTIKRTEFWGIKIPSNELRQAL
jgi:hypothetical protein